MAKNTNMLLLLGAGVLGAGLVYVLFSQRALGAVQTADVRYAVKPPPGGAIDHSWTPGMSLRDRLQARRPDFVASPVEMPITNEAQLSQLSTMDEDWMPGAPTPGSSFHL